MNNMILEDEGKAICQNYVPEAVQDLPQANMEERMLNAHELRDHEVHDALAADLVQQAWSVRYIPNPGGNEEEEEEEEEGDEEEEEDEHEYEESEDEN
jgi:hypothetical protein